MAYRGESSEMMTVAAQTVTETAPQPADKPAVATGDARRVRLAIGLMIVLAIVDLCLYLPRIL